MSQGTIVQDYRFIGKHRPAADGATVNGPFTTKITGAGPPTVKSNSGVLDLALEATVEVQNACYYWGDELGILIDKLLAIDIWAKLTASLPAQVTASFGVSSARNDTPTSASAYALFQYAGANTQKIATADGVTTVAPVATGLSLSTTLRRHRISFGGGVLTQAAPSLSLGGKANVYFYSEDGNGLLQRVGQTTLFNMNGYALGLQPVFQIQKTSNAAVGTLSIERIQLTYRQG